MTPRMRFQLTAVDEDWLRAQHIATDPPSRVQMLASCAHSGWRMRRRFFGGPEFLDPLSGLWLSVEDAYRALYEPLPPAQEMRAALEFAGWAVVIRQGHGVALDPQTLRALPLARAYREVVCV